MCFRSTRGERRAELASPAARWSLPRLLAYLVEEETQNAVEMLRAHAGDEPIRDVIDTTSASFWDAQYSGRDQKWSGNANPHLVDIATRMRAGAALDVGSGEGADALWLASRGWMVTGIDISTIAIGRARDAAAEAGLSRQAEFVDTDFEEWAATTTATFDLVSIHFLHLATAKRDRMVTAASTLVTDGGRILIVGHDAAAEHLRLHPQMADIYFTVDAVRTLLPKKAWTVRSARLVAREAGDQHPADVVVEAVRKR